MRKLFNDEVGMVVSAELVLVLTIGVLAMVVGLAAARDTINSELNDLSEAFGTVSQSYKFTGAIASTGVALHPHGIINASGFQDTADICDCKGIDLICVCGKTQTAGGATTTGQLAGE